jgi:hypothetical protein
MTTANTTAGIWVISAAAEGEDDQPYLFATKEAALTWALANLDDEFPDSWEVEEGIGRNGSAATGWNEDAGMGFTLYHRNLMG